LVFLSLFAAERAAELLLSRRNARLALAQGAVETGAVHFRWMALLHAAWFAACAIEAARRSPPIALAALAAAVAIAAQALRWWAIASLGARWNVRVIALPGAAPVRRGPYRFVRHPNYLAVILEIACVPLAGGAWLTAAIFSLLNAWALRVRIRDEEGALGEAYARDFAQTPRFIPHG
jgi:methyltransferase